MIRIVKMNYKEEHVQDFLNLFEERKLQIRNSKGCNYLELWNDKDNQTIYYSYSIWDDLNDLNEYRHSELFKDTWAKFKSWFQDKPQVFNIEKKEIVL